MTSAQIPPHWLAPSPPVPVDEDPEQRPEAEPAAPLGVPDPDEASARSSELG